MNDVKFRMSIDGDLVDSPQALDIINPATGGVFARAPDCTAEQLDLAVAAARAAFGSWKNIAIGERRSSLQRLAAQLEDNTTVLAELLTSEQGKPLSDARLEIGMAVTHFRETAELELPWLSEAGPRPDLRHRRSQRLLIARTYLIVIRVRATALRTSLHGTDFVELDLYENTTAVSRPLFEDGARDSLPTPAHRVCSRLKYFLPVVHIFCGRLLCRWRTVSVRPLQGETGCHP